MAVTDLLDLAAYALAGVGAGALSAASIRDRRETLYWIILLVCCAAGIGVGVLVHREGLGIGVPPPITLPLA